MILDAGSGHNPWPHADVLCDLFVGPTRHRGAFSYMPAIRGDRPFVCASVEALPFKTRAFTFVWCSHVLEHANHPDVALSELQRVGEHGRVAFPSGLWRYLTSNPKHQWAINPRGGDHKDLTKGRVGAIIRVISRILRYNFHIHLRERAICVFERLLKRDIHEATIWW